MIKRTIRNKALLGIALLVAFMIFAAGSCDNNPAEQDNNRQQQVQERVRNQGPIHDPNYSQTYDTINMWLERWDSADKVSYVYLFADTGQTLGYYVAQGRPVNICTFLTAPYRIVDRGDGGDVVVPAPALDGVYYGNTGCDSWYFFTADTDAYVEIGGGMKFFVTDQPLSIEAEELRVSQ